MRASEFYLPAPAKLNLYLHIVGQRPDGYHELETVFQFLTLGDVLAFRATPPAPAQQQPTVTVVVQPFQQCPVHNPWFTDANLLPSADLQQLQATPHEQNLVYRAALLLRSKAPADANNITITLYKQLPIGGGIGGGSSNAATALLGLNYAWGLGLSQQELAELGLALGADVPVFVHGHATFAAGVGERFQATQPAEVPYLLIHPQVHISTAAIFRHPQLPRNTAASHKPLADWQTGHNDCEKLARSLYPAVASSLEWLLKYAPSRMTGTGACVFAPFPSAEHATQALLALPAEFRGVVAHGVNQSPLQLALNALP